MQNLRGGGPLAINHHVQAMSILLRLRTPMNRITSAAPALAFERICVESFIYQSATIMLFDSTLDLVSTVQQLVKKFESCFITGSESLPSSCFDKLPHSSVLGASPDVFVVLMQETKLARSAQLLTEASANNLRHQNWQILHREQHSQSSGLREIWEGRLYVLATRALVIRDAYTRNRSTSDFHAFEFHQTIIEGLQILSTYTLRAPFKNYYLLPLAIFGSVLTSEDDVAVIREKFDLITERSNRSTIKHIRDILEEVWRSQAGSTENFAIDGLGMLLRCANITNPTSDS